MKDKTGIQSGFDEKKSLSGMELSLRNVIGKVYSALRPGDGLHDLSKSPQALFYNSVIN